MFFLDVTLLFFFALTGEAEVRNPQRQQSSLLSVQSAFVVLFIESRLVSGSEKVA